MDFSNNSSAVQQDLRDLRDSKNVSATLRDFSRHLSEMSYELDEKVKRYEMGANHKDNIIAGYAENFIYSVVQILVRAHEAADLRLGDKVPSEPPSDPQASPPSPPKQKKA